MQTHAGFHKKKYGTLRMITAALCLSLCMVLPLLTGQIPEIGKMMLPMHFGVFICAYTAGWEWAVLVGAIAPLMRSMLFGMPVLYPTAISMAFELATYGLVAGILNEKLKKTLRNLYVSLLISMVCGRLVSGVVNLVLYGLQGTEYTLSMFLSASFVQAIPGIILQLIVVPVVVMAIRKSRLPIGSEPPAIKEQDIISFFNARAGHWDDQMIKNQKVVDSILDNAEVTEGKKVLDVATGTGVLIEDYIKRKVSDITAIDISPEMVKICRDKYKGIRILCGDAAEEKYPDTYDCIVVYNAFPHFADPEQLISHLVGVLNPGGTLTIAHGMSREKIDGCHHHGEAAKVSRGLMEIEDLSELLSEVLDVTVQISNDRMYQVVGKKRDNN